jgi:hypothetical protein
MNSTFTPFALFLQDALRQRDEQAREAAAERSVLLAGHTRFNLNCRRHTEFTVSAAINSGPACFALFLQDALRQRDEQAREAAAERSALRRDLERILRERGTLDSMRRLVGSLVGSPAGTSAAAAAAGISAVGGAGQAAGAAIG